MGKRILALLTGFVVSFITIGSLEFLSNRFFPIPVGVDFADPESVKNMMANMPLGAMIFVLVAYAIGSFAGGLSASWVAGRIQKQPSIIIGLVLTFGGIANVLQMPGQPLWMVITSFLIYLPFSYLGFLAIRKK